MKKWNLRIILKSDLCAATGEDAPGITNVKTALECGIPYIPAKRIKGCLLEAGREMKDNGLLKQEILEHLFGKPGAEHTEGVYISDAHVYSIPCFMFEEEGPFQIEDYELFQREVQNRTESEKAYFEEIFTRKRTRTAIDAETGSAKKHSLRTIQVVPAGIEFVSVIEGELDIEDEAVLKNCAKGLRHMGLGITRGLGEVRCVLEAVPDTFTVDEQRHENTRYISKEKVKILKEFKPEEDVVLSYEISLDSPIMIDGDGGCLPAGPVLGALAEMYIRKFSLGADAHKNEGFRRIFLEGGVQFGYGYLKRGKRMYFPCPNAIAEMKALNGKWFHTEGNKGMKRKGIRRQVYWEGNELHIASAHKEIHFHHSRPADRGIAHAINERAEDAVTPAGEFFQYTALSKGQTYVGTWCGKAKDIITLTECLEANNCRLRLGRSKTAEYGACTFKITDAALKNVQPDSTLHGTKWMMWLLTPMISRDEVTGEYTLDTDVLKKQFEKALGCKVADLRKTAVSYTVHSGYNSRWRMPSVSCPALAPGSTFYLETEREIRACEIEANRWGEQTGRGCGQIAVRPWDKNETGEIIIDTDKMDAEKTPNGIVDRLLNLRKHQLKCENTAIEVLDHISETELPPSSAISLLIQLLRSYDKEDDFYGQIKNEVNRIQKTDKRDKILKLIEPCEGKTYEFMKQFLEDTKWKARCRGKDE